MLADLSSKVAVTCDEFLNVLQECMDLSMSRQIGSTLKPLPLAELYAPKKGGIECSIGLEMWCVTFDL